MNLYEHKWKAFVNENKDYGGPRLLNENVDETLASMGFTGGGGVENRRPVAARLLDIPPESYTGTTEQNQKLQNMLNNLIKANFGPGGTQLNFDHPHFGLLPGALDHIARGGQPVADTEAEVVTDATKDDTADLPPPTATDLYGAGVDPRVGGLSGQPAFQTRKSAGGAGGLMNPRLSSDFGPQAAAIRGTYQDPRYIGRKIKNPKYKPGGEFGLGPTIDPGEAGYDDAAQAQATAPGLGGMIKRGLPFKRNVYGGTLVGDDTMVGGIKGGANADPSLAYTHGQKSPQELAGPNTLDPARAGKDAQGKPRSVEPTAADYATQPGAQGKMSREDFKAAVAAQAVRNAALDPAYGSTFQGADIETIAQRIGDMARSQDVDDALTQGLSMAGASSEEADHIKKQARKAMRKGDLAAIPRTLGLDKGSRLGRKRLKTAKKADIAQQKADVLALQTKQLGDQIGAGPGAGDKRVTTKDVAKSTKKDGKGKKASGANFSTKKQLGAQVRAAGRSGIQRDKTGTATGFTDAGVEKISNAPTKATQRAASRSRSKGSKGKDHAQTYGTYKMQTAAPKTPPEAPKAETPKKEALNRIINDEFQRYIIINEEYAKFENKLCSIMEEEYAAYYINNK